MRWISSSTTNNNCPKYSKLEPKPAWEQLTWYKTSYTVSKAVTGEFKDRPFGQNYIIALLAQHESHINAETNGAYYDNQCGAQTKEKYLHETEWKKSASTTYGLLFPKYYCVSKATIPALNGEYILDDVQQFGFRQKYRQ